jgi:hypothetical protein
MADLYHIFIRPHPPNTRAEVEEKLNLALDWFRYQDACYVVETTSDENKWKTRLLPLVEPDGFLFICKLDESHHHGFMKPSFWKWFDAKLKKDSQ